MVRGLQSQVGELRPALRPRQTEALVRRLRPEGCVPFRAPAADKRAFGSLGCVRADGRNGVCSKDLQRIMLNQARDASQVGQAAEAADGVEVRSDGVSP